MYYKSMWMAIQNHLLGGDDHNGGGWGPIAKAVWATRRRSAKDDDVTTLTVTKNTERVTDLYSVPSKRVNHSADFFRAFPPQSGHWWEFCNTGARRPMTAGDDCPPITERIAIAWGCQVLFGGPVCVRESGSLLDGTEYRYIDNIYYILSISVEWAKAAKVLRNRWQPKTWFDQQDCHRANKGKNKTRSYCTWFSPWISDSTSSSSCGRPGVAHCRTLKLYLFPWVRRCWRPFFKLGSIARPLCLAVSTADIITSRHYARSHRRSTVGVASLTAPVQLATAVVVDRCSWNDQSSRTRVQPPEGLECIISILKPV